MEIKTELLIAIAFLCVIVFIIGYFVGWQNSRISLLKESIKKQIKIKKPNTNGTDSNNE